LCKKSIVQISDENVHLIRNLLDEVFGVDNFISMIPFRKKTMPLGAVTLETMNDYLVWYAKSKSSVKYNQLYENYNVEGASRWTMVELPDGARRHMTSAEAENHSFHYITYDALYKIVLDDVRRKAFVARLFTNRFTEMLTTQTAGAIREKLKTAEKEIKRLSARAVELEQIIGKLYEDHALGRISAERFDSFMLKYEAEKKQVESGLKATREVFEEEQKQLDNADRFTEVILSYTDLKELTAPILNELVDRIEIGKKEVVNGEKTQSVRILYKQVGYVEDFMPWDLFDDVPRR